MEIVRPFSQISKEDVLLAGGKGASLGEMTQAGIQVPPGFVVLSGAFDHFVKEAGLHDDIDAILDKVNTEAIHTVEDASEQIQAIILNAEMPKEVESEIKKSFKKLKAKYVAVRSSATTEDSADAAWAGQLDTYLNTTEVDLLENVKRCWASLFTPRAIFYRFEKELHKTDVSVAVVIQKMIESESSGIAFSVHPVTEDENQLIIEAGYGLGEAIVSGQITPDSYVVTKDKEEVDITVNEQSKALYRAEGGGNEWKDLGKEGGEQVLEEPHIKELAKLAVKIEAHYGFPVDIEWARVKGEFYITQSRPITTLQKKTKEKEEYLTFQITGYPYFYSPVINAAKIKYGGKEITGDWYLKFLKEEASTAKVPIRSFAAGKDFIKLLKKNDPKFSKYFFSLCKKIIATAKKLDERNYLDHKEDNVSDLKEFYEEYKEIFSEAISYGYLLDAFLDRYVEENSIDLTKLGQVGSSFIMKEMSDLRKVFEEKDKAKFKEKLKEHSFRYSWINSSYTGENKLEIKDFLARKKEVIKFSGEIVEKEIEVPKDLSEWISLLVYVRDERKKINLIGSALLDRYLKKECVKKDVSYEKATMLTCEEFEKERPNIKDYGDERRMHITKKGIKDLSSGEWNDLFKEEELGKFEKISGQPASSGKVRGRVKIILIPKDFNKLKKGEIIVASMTRPEYAPILGKCSAIITNEGGVTCHAAIISRELKIPCIIGTKIATKVLKDGMEVEVDANEGVVKILEKKESKELPILKKLKRHKFEKYESYPHTPVISWEYALYSSIKNPYFKKLKLSRTPNLVILQEDNYEGWRENKTRISVKDKKIIQKIIADSLKFIKKHEKEIKEKLDVDPNKLNSEICVEWLNRINELLIELFHTYSFYTEEYFHTSDEKLLKELPEVRIKLSNFIDILWKSCDKILDFIKKKYSIPRKISNTLISSEILEILESKAGKIKDLKEHPVAFSIIDEEIKTFIGDDAIKIKKFLEEQDPLKSQIREVKKEGELSGNIAYKGTIRGDVIRITEKDYDTYDEIFKNKKGYILVAPMTRPEIVPFLKNAAAIVTDEGGVTCHAAIVSRELKIPCIIATKVATKVLKDGMEVEVDADNGVVKILKRK